MHAVGAPIGLIPRASGRPSEGDNFSTYADFQIRPPMVNLTLSYGLLQQKKKVEGRWRAKERDFDEPSIIHQKMIFLQPDNLNYLNR